MQGPGGQSYIVGSAMAFATLGLPEVIITDNGTAFMSPEFV